MEEPAIHLAELANADCNLSTNDEVVTKLNFCSVGTQPSGERSIRDREFTTTENITALTRSLCSFSGLRSAASTIAAELISNNNADESNVENNIPSSNNPHAPSKHRTKKRVFIALDNNDDDGVVSRISRGVRKVFVRPIRNRSLTLNGEGFNNTRDYKRLRTIYNPQQSNSTSNKLTNNATDKSSATDTTAAVEEEEVEFFTENGGFDNEEGDTLLGDGASGGALNEGDSIKEPMDISVDEERSPSTITSAVSNTRENKSVANDLILDGDELQSSHFNNDTALGGRGGSSKGGRILAAAVAAVDNNVLPGAGEESSIRASDAVDDSAIAPRKSPRLNANTGEIVANGDMMRTSPRLHNSESVPETPRHTTPTNGMLMSVNYKEDGGGSAWHEAVVCNVSSSSSTVDLAFVDKEGVVIHVDDGVQFPHKDVKLVKDKDGGVKMGTVPVDWKEWKPPQDVDIDGEDIDIDVEDDGK